MLDDAFIFSNNQAITVSAASNYPGTGFGSAGAGVFDTGSLYTSPGGSGGYGQNGMFGGAVKKFTLFVSVGVPFVGPAGATILVFMQDSADNVNWATTDLGNTVASVLAQLQVPGASLLQGDLPGLGGSTAIAIPILRQYLRVFYTVAGGPFTLGTVNARVDLM